MPDKRQCILNLINENTVCAEIGVWKGDFSRKIIKNNPKHLYLIDPWKYQEYEGRWYSIEQEKMENIYQNVKRDFLNFQNVSIIRDFSENVKFQKEMLDLIYIDGNHSYEFVLKDLNHYYKFMKKKSYITGDDYGWTDRHCKRGPATAVREFCKINKLNFEVINRQFIIRLEK